MRESIVMAAQVVSFMIRDLPHLSGLVYFGFLGQENPRHKHLPEDFNSSIFIYPFAVYLWTCEWWFCHPGPAWRYIAPFWRKIRWSTKPPPCGTFPPIPCWWNRHGWLCGNLDKLSRWFYRHGSEAPYDDPKDDNWGVRRWGRPAGAELPNLWEWAWFPCKEI